MISEPKTPCIEASWKKVLDKEFQKPYMQALKGFLRDEKDQKKIIYPNSKNIFKAFEYTPFNQVKVVILGQDPYHGANQAHGLCFSVMPGVRLPPSLQNIYKELQADCGISPVNHGCLVSWAKQGVLLLNSVLTVEHGKAASHNSKGWETFTDAIIVELNKQIRPMAFVLWGNYAQAKGEVIDGTKHLVIKSAHPSPFSAHRGFLGSKPFTKINTFLTQRGETPIQWQLPIEPDL